MTDNIRSFHDGLLPSGKTGPLEALIKSLSAFILEFLCNARNGKGNSELFKESHDEAVHKNSYKIRFCELISASLEAAESIVYRYRRFIVKENTQKMESSQFCLFHFLWYNEHRKRQLASWGGNGSLIIF
jgi:hypothetical protein